MRIVIENTSAAAEDLDALAMLLARKLSEELGFTVEVTGVTTAPAILGDVPVPNRVTDLAVRMRGKLLTVTTSGAKLAAAPSRPVPPTVKRTPLARDSRVKKT